jgi:hypothetical protein
MGPGICRLSPGWFNISHSHKVVFAIDDPCGTRQFSVAPAARIFFIRVRRVCTYSHACKMLGLGGKCLARATYIFQSGSSDDMLANPENSSSGEPESRDGSYRSVVVSRVFSSFAGI